MTPTKLQSLIASMLTEKTGVALMDSVGENGRMWQRNAGKNVQAFLNEPRVTAEANDGYIDFNVSTFHYLTSGVIELDELCNEFNALPCDDWDGEAYGISKAQQKWLAVHGFTIGNSWNTYNGENELSQILQGTNLEKDGCGEGEYFLMQVHGGADVRGGYTDAKLFKNSEFQAGIDPCPSISGEIDGVPYQRYGTDYVNQEGQSFAPAITPASKVTAYLDNE